VKIKAKKYIIGAIFLGTLLGISNFFFSFLTVKTALLLIGSCMTATFLYVIASKLLTKKLYKGAPFVQSSTDVINIMIEMAGGGTNQKVADIGSGDGKIAIAFAKKGFLVTGIEINPLLALFSKFNLFRNGLINQVQIQNKNFWSTDLSDFNIITVFGIEFIMKDLEKKLLRELKPGAKVISNIFKFPNWQHKEQKDGVFLYEKT